MYNYKWSVGPTALIVVYLIFPIPAANAQIETGLQAMSGHLGRNGSTSRKKLWSCQILLRQVRH